MQKTNSGKNDLVNISDTEYYQLQNGKEKSESATESKSSTCRFD